MAHTPINGTWKQYIENRHGYLFQNLGRSPAFAELLYRIRYIYLYEMNSPNQLCA